MSHVCALYFFTNMHGGAKSAQQKSILHCVWSCGRFAMQNALPGHMQRSAQRQARWPVCNALPIPRSECMQCIWRAALVYLFTFFNLFVGLFGIITFDPFYKTNNTLILHALAELQHDFGHSQCHANRTRRPPPPPPGSFGLHHDCKCPQCMLHCR